MRFLRNVMGQWVLSQTIQAWVARGEGVELAALLGTAADAPAFQSLIDIDAPRLRHPET